MKKVFRDLKAGDVFELENPISKGTQIVYLRTNVGVVNMVSWTHVDAFKVRDWISQDQMVKYVGNLTQSKALLILNL